MRPLSRRDLLSLVVASPMFGARLQGRSPSAPSDGTALRRAVTDLSLSSIARAPGLVVDADGVAVTAVDLVREWNGPVCRARVVNRGAGSVRVKEVVLFDVAFAAPPATALYGEGFQMLTATGGTLAAPIDFSQYTDAAHYRIPASEGARAYYGLLTLSPSGDDTRVLAFTSCSRFSARFELRGSSLRALIDTVASR